ncbi:CDP-alcohol phosphatidyltransferase family protein [Candidatus Planktophila versatilis]|uniref:CDP-alcohol phosphatidyltransferase family protein n=1 Tax=Candidatus Planktophila versatilis TaxID=1884905 RepID=UPI003CF24FCA
MLTIPNALTFLRFLGIPLFILLALDQRADGWAILVLMIGGATDYFDGKLARALHQESRFGEIADPTIDRLYIAATIIVLYIRDAIPLWVILVLVARDVSMAILALVIQMRGLPTLQVTYLGKAATFNLLYAFPFLLLALNPNWYGTVAFIFGWAFTGWGVALYVATAIGYFRTGINSITVRPEVI